MKFIHIFFILLENKIIFTKIDKLSNNEKFKQLKEIRTRLVFENEDVFFHSSHTNKGREEILSFIEENLKGNNKLDREIKND